MQRECFGFCRYFLYYFLFSSGGEIFKNMKSMRERVNFEMFSTQEMEFLTK